MFQSVVKASATKYFGSTLLDFKGDIREVSNLRRTSLGNEIVDHSDVVGASPVGAAPTTSSFSTKHWLQWIGQRQVQGKTRNLYVWGLGAFYIRELTVLYLLQIQVWILYVWEWQGGICGQTSVNTLRPRQNGRHFADDIFRCIFFNENVWTSLKFSLKFVPDVRINNIPALVQIMAWRRPGDKPLSEPMMVRSPTHICVNRPRWVNMPPVASIVYLTVIVVTWNKNIGKLEARWKND